jgi:hypothetical protein
VRTVLGSLTIMAVLTACPQSGKESQSSTAPSGPTGVSSTGGPSTDPGSTGVPPTSDDGEGTPITFGPGDYQLVDPAVAIDSLPASQATLTISFDGTRAGAAEQWTQTEVAVVNREPRRSQFTSERTGSGAFTLLNLTTGGVHYSRSNGGECTVQLPQPDAEATADDFAVRSHPVDLLPALIGGDEAGTETIGAVETTHYTFDERALGLTSPVSATGDVWLAQAEGYVVRYSLVIEGASPYLGLSATGRYTIDYEQQPLVAPPDVTVPPDCPAGLVDVPPPADATGVVNHPGVQTLTTAGTPADAQAWYDSQLVAAGWTAVTAPLIVDGAELLTYARPGERLTVSLIGSGTATSVIVLLIKSP